ncbi:MAG: CoA transferase [Dehalococcoidia bacterium]
MLALVGIKVLDLTRLAPGPYCTMILADLGADVIKVEEPGPPTGRRAEQAGQAVQTSLLTGQVSPFDALNRNKRSIGLNLKHEDARRIFYELAETADVVVEEFRPGVSKRLGIDYDTLSGINSSSETPGQIRRPPPRRCQHTDEVLRGLGYTGEEINRLRREGAAL